MRTCLKTISLKHLYTTLLLTIRSSYSQLEVLWLFQQSSSADFPWMNTFLSMSFWYIHLFESIGVIRHESFMDCRVNIHSCSYICTYRNDKDFCMEMQSNCAICIFLIFNRDVNMWLHYIIHFSWVSIKCQWCPCMWCLWNEIWGIQNSIFWLIMLYGKVLLYLYGKPLILVWKIINNYAKDLNSPVRV